MHDKCLVLVVVKGVAHPSLPLILFYIAGNEQEAQDICNEFLFTKLVGWRLQVFDPVSFRVSYPNFILQNAVTNAIFLAERNLGTMEWLDESFDSPAMRQGLQQVADDFAGTHHIENDEAIVQLPWLLFQDKTAVGEEA